MHNPYVADRPLTEQDLFYGRDEHFQRLISWLHAGRRFFLLYGKRYAGKTSFLNQLPLRLSTRYAIWRIDPTPFIDKDFDPLWVIMLCLASALGQPEPDPGTYRAQGEAYCGEYLRSLSLPADENVHLICIDALPLAPLPIAEEWQAVFDAVRAGVQSIERLAILLAIEGHPAELGLEASHADIQIVMGPLQPSETEEALMLPARGVLAYDYEAVRRIHRLTGGQPAFVQLFGHILFDRRSHAGWVGLPEIDHAIDQVVAFGKLQFEAVWEASTPRDRVVLCAFAEMIGSHGIGSAQNVASYLARLGVQMPLRDIEEALALLARAQVFERLGGGTFRFSSELLRYWLKQNRSTLDAVRQARRYRRARVRPMSPLRNRRIDWVGLLLWIVAGLLAVGIGFVWSSRQKGIVWTLEPTPIPQRTWPATELTPTVIPPTPDTGVAPGRIVYMARERQDAKWQIFVMRSDGVDPVRLTNDASDNTSPMLSPDGRRIVFVSDRDGNREIYVMNADGNEPINLTRNPAEDWTPAWSPDGKRIAFASFRDRNWEIYVMNADGSKPERLTNHNAIDYGPSWSPDGRHIAFTSSRDGNLEIYIMDADGKNQKRFTQHGATDQSPTWSADGQRIFWESYRDNNMEIYAANVDGSGLQNVTRDPQADDHGVTCSPWGRHIAFFSNRDGGWDIFTLDLETGQRTNITMSATQEQAPHWGR